MGTDGPKSRNRAWLIYAITGFSLPMNENARVAWVLALLSPVVAELMSGSSPPLEFLNPIVFAGLLGMYGTGVLMVREISVSWSKGWATVILLGAAYGIIEEGLAVKSFFDPGWMDLGDLGEYGRYWSTNWVWSFWLTIFHATVSIALPILLVQLLYPHLRSQRLLNPFQFRIVLVLFVVDVSVFALLFSVNYVPQAVQYLLAACVVAAFVYIAKRLPSGLVSASHPNPTWPPWKFFLLGLNLLFTSFIVASGALTREAHPVMVIMVLLLISAATLLLLQHKMGASGNRVHKACFASGILSVWVFFGVVNEFSGYFGMSVVALFAALFIVDLTRWSKGKRPLTLLRRFPTLAG